MEELPSVVYIVTNETKRELESVFYKSKDALKEFHRLAELRPSQVFMIVEQEIIKW